jgi:tetratricopeptide (TPR) repeat protein
MSHRALFTFALFVLAAGATRAQENPANPTQVATNVSAPAPMSPREAAEMHADILMARKEYGSAITAYQQIVATEPKNAALLNKIGVAYQQLGAANHAGHFYKQAMKADKKFASPVNNLGTIEYDKKHYGKAINLYKKALLFKMDLATVYSNLGYAYFANKEYPESMDAFAKALEIDPHVFERRSGTGSIVQQRSMDDPGLFYFFVAKSYAAAGNAERTAHYLKLARDDGYKNFLSAQSDPAFAHVIKDPQVQEVLQVTPSYEDEAKKPQPN